MLPVFPRSTRLLCDEILAEARARGVRLEQESLKLELDLPVLRLRLADRVLRTAQAPSLRRRDLRANDKLSLIYMRTVVSRASFAAEEIRRDHDSIKLHAHVHGTFGALD